MTPLLLKLIFTRMPSQSPALIRPIVRGVARTVLERMVEYEIAQRDVEGARALLAELSGERPELEKKIAVLMADIDETKADAARLQAMERDADLRIGARFQLMIIGILPLCAALSFVLVATGAGDQALLLRQLVTFPLVLLILLIGMFLALRKRITTAIGRRAFGMLLLYPLSLLLHRAFAIRQGNSISSMLIADLVFSSILALSFAISILPSSSWISVVFLAGAIAITKFPNHAMTICLTSGTIATFMLVAFWARMILQTNRQNKR